MIPGRTGINFRVVKDLAEFMALEGVWNSVLLKSPNPRIFLTFEWFADFIRAFRVEDRLFVIVIRDGEETVGLLPLLREETTIHGVPARALVSITNVHTPKYDFIVEGGYEGLIERALGNSLSAYRWDMIRLDDVVDDSYLITGFRPGFWKGLSIRRAEQRKSPHLFFETSWTEYWNKSFAKSLRNDIQRLERQAAAKYGVDFERISGTRLGHRDIREAFAIEDSGWKGAQKSSILKDTKVEDFYARLAFDMNSRDWFDLYFLKFGDRRVAFEYCLKFAGMICPLKIGYDEGYRRFGPGNILRKHVLEESFSNGYRKYDLLGTLDSYKLRWTNRVETLYSLFVFHRGAKSRLLQFLLFGASERLEKMNLKGRVKTLQSRILRRPPKRA